MPFVDRKQSVLLVIDAQPGFYPPARTDVDHAAKDAALERVAWVAGTAVALAVPVVVTEEDPAVNGHTAASIVRYLDSSVAVLGKEVFGAADNPAILSAVESTGRSTVVLVGMETDVCVAHSALSLRERGYRPVVVHNAVFSAADAHGHGLARLQREGIELVSAKELYYDWVRTLSDARGFERGNPGLATPPGFSL